MNSARAHIYDQSATDCQYGDFQKSFSSDIAVASFFDLSTWLVPPTELYQAIEEDASFPELQALHQRRGWAVSPSQRPGVIISGHLGPCGMETGYSGSLSENMDHVSVPVRQASSSPANDLSPCSIPTSHDRSISSSVASHRTSSPLTTSRASLQTSCDLDQPFVASPNPIRPALAFGILSNPQQDPRWVQGSLRLPLIVNQAVCQDDDGAMTVHGMARGAQGQTSPSTTANAPGFSFCGDWSPSGACFAAGGPSAEAGQGTLNQYPPSYESLLPVFDLGMEDRSILDFHAADQPTAGDKEAQSRRALLARGAPAAQPSTLATALAPDPATAQCRPKAHFPTSFSESLIAVPDDLRIHHSVPPHEDAQNRTSTENRSSREQIPSETWEQHKAVIRMLYLEERKPLKEVMSIMEKEFGFHATTKVYKTRFSQWGFAKNNTESEVKRLLSMKLKRDAEGKVSEFVRNGKVINLGTYLKRKGMTELDLIDSELPAELPAHISCRTPSPPPLARPTDPLHAQELITSNLRAFFLQSQRLEAQEGPRTEWQSTLLWGALSSEILLEADSLFKIGDAGQAMELLHRALKQLEMDMETMSTKAVVELIQGLIGLDPGVLTALCKYVAAGSTMNLGRLHPLRQIFRCLDEILGKYGTNTLSEVLRRSGTSIAKELEAVHGRCHPLVVRTWADLAIFQDQVNLERLTGLVSELRKVLEKIERQYGITDHEAAVLRFTIMQLQYSCSPRSEATKQAVQELWSLFQRMGRVYPMHGVRNSYCFYSFVNAHPSTSWCKRRYDAGRSMMEEHLGVRIHAHFNHESAPDH